MSRNWLAVLLIALVAGWIYLERAPEQPGGVVVLRWVVNSQERDQQFAAAARRAWKSDTPGCRGLIRSQP